MAPQDNRSRELEEEEEIWMDQDLGLDEDTVRRIMRILIRSAIRLQQLTILEADRSYVFSGQHDLASEVRGRDSPNLTAGHAVGSHLDGMAGPTGEDRERCTCFNWQSGRDGRLGNADSAPVGIQRVEPGAEESAAAAVQPRQPTARRRQKSGGTAIKNTAKDGTVHRFQSLKPPKQDLQTEVVVMILTLTVRQHAAEVYRDLDLLENNCAGKLIGLRLRKERVSKSALAKELERLQL
eukprot:s2120_g13.t1